MPMIEVSHIYAHYGLRPILRDVSCTVERSELLAVMGPNGAGKSTLLGVIAGAMAPMDGYVAIDGKRRRSSMEDENAIRQKTAYLATPPFLPSGHSGREFLIAVGRLYDIKYSRLFEHANRLLKLYNLTEVADSPIASYSTGQRKKIALASILITDASVLVLDEPFSGGMDPAGITTTRKVLSHLAKREDVTIVMATPVPELVEDLAHRVLLMHHGKVIACDTIEALRERSDESSLETVYTKLMAPESVGATCEYVEWSEN